MWRGSAQGPRARRRTRRTPLEALRRAKACVAESTSGRGTRRGTLIWSRCTPRRSRRGDERAPGINGCRCPGAQRRQACDRPGRPYVGPAGRHRARRQHRGQASAAALAVPLHVRTRTRRPGRFAPCRAHPILRVPACRGRSRDRRSGASTARCTLKSRSAPTTRRRPAPKPMVVACRRAASSG